MSEARLASTMLVSGFLRLAGEAGGFAAILARGDPVFGALLIQMLEKGAFFGLFERVLDSSGRYEWRRTRAQAIEDKGNSAEYLERRRARDPDLWIVELDVPDAERFVAEKLSNA